MSATSAVTPVNWNHIAADYWSPKTAGSKLYIRPSEGGTDYAAFDGANTQFQCNKIVPYSGSVIDHGSNSLLIGTATTYQHAVRASQVQSGELVYGLTTGTQPDYVLTTSVVPTGGYAPGMVVRIRCHSTHSSGTPTLNYGALGAKNIIHNYSGSALATGFLQAGGLYELMYDGTAFVVMKASHRVTGSTPTITGSGAMTVSATSYAYCISTIVPEGVHINIYVTFTTSGTPDSILYLTGLPITALASNPAGSLSVNLWTGAGYEGAMAVALNNYIEVRKLSGTISNGTLRALTITGTYRLP